MVEVMRYAVVAQACRLSPLRSSAMVRIDGGDDRLVERGEEHPRHQRDQDDDDLAVGEQRLIVGGAGAGGGAGGYCGTHTISWSGLR